MVGDRRGRLRLLVEVDRRVDLQSAVDERCAVLGRVRAQILGDLLLDKGEDVGVDLA
jgi:hypothetical protein